MKKALSKRKRAEIYAAPASSSSSLGGGEDGTELEGEDGEGDAEGGNEFGTLREKLQVSKL